MTFRNMFDSWMRQMAQSSLGENDARVQACAFMVGATALRAAQDAGQSSEEIGAEIEAILSGIHRELIVASTPIKLTVSEN